MKGHCDGGVGSSGGGSDDACDSEGCGGVIFGVKAMTENRGQKGESRVECRRGNV